MHSLLAVITKLMDTPNN